MAEDPPAVSSSNGAYGPLERNRMALDSEFLKNWSPVDHLDMSSGENGLVFMTKNLEPCARVPSTAPFPGGCEANDNLSCISHLKKGMELYCCSAGVEAINHPELCFVYPAPQITMCDIVYQLTYGRGCTVSENSTTMSAQTMVSTKSGRRLICDMDFWPDKDEEFDGVEILEGCRGVPEGVTAPSSERGFDPMGDPGCASPSDWPRKLISQLFLGLGDNFGGSTVETIKLVRDKLVDFRVQLSDLMEVTNSDHANQVWVDIATGFPGALGSLVFLFFGMMWVYRKCSACACAKVTRVVKEREAKERAEKGEDAPLMSGESRANPIRGPGRGGEERIEMAPQGPTQSSYPERQRPNAPLATFDDNLEAERLFRMEVEARRIVDSVR